MAERPNNASLAGILSSLTFRQLYEGEFGPAQTRDAVTISKLLTKKFSPLYDPGSTYVLHAELPTDLKEYQDRLASMIDTEASAVRERVEETGEADATAILASVYLINLLGGPTAVMRYLTTALPFHRTDDIRGDQRVLLSAKVPADYFSGRTFNIFQTEKDTATQPGEAWFSLGATHPNDNANKALLVDGGNGHHLVLQDRFGNYSLTFNMIDSDMPETNRVAVSPTNGEAYLSLQYNPYFAQNYQGQLPSLTELKEEMDLGFNPAALQLNVGIQTSVDLPTDTGRQATFDRHGDIWGGLVGKQYLPVALVSTPGIQVGEEFFEGTVYANGSDADAIRFLSQR